MFEAERVKRSELSCRFVNMWQWRNQSNSQSKGGSLQQPQELLWGS